ncbi:MAG: PDZ domain-containing protein [Gloeobacteraceae cyanobacterium ES-bin-144]|nr:PDZ domain-containing protein [Verrucomicrobiales bacterium]
MRFLIVLPIIAFLTACQPPKEKITSHNPSTDHTTTEKPPVSSAPVDVKLSVIRVNSTQQSWNPWQPWEKNPTRQRRALAAIVAPQRVLTLSELVADATFLEFESPDGTRFTPAKVIAVDYEANLALLGPATEETGAEFFKDTAPLEISRPSRIGDDLDILQVEENGVTLRTPGNLQSIDLTSGFLPGASFLTYMVKASMQSAASSYSLPVLQDNKLAGVLMSYDSKDQLCDVVSTDIVARFLKEAQNEKYVGFPSLGVSIARTEDASFRKWLKLTDDQGGLYVQKVRKGSSAALAGIKPGDVILTIDDHAIDRRGYYEHESYGSLSWGHLIRGEKSTGDIVAIGVLREGNRIVLNATLTREDDNTRLIPSQRFNKAPNYLVKGGLIFQELSRPILESFGDEWQSRAPLDLLDAYENPEKYEDGAKRIVFLSGVIPTPATVGYERLRNLIVQKVNGKEIKNVKDLIAAFDDNDQPLHSIEFKDENLTVNLDEVAATGVDSLLLQRGISRLSHTE